MCRRIFAHVFKLIGHNLENMNLPRNFFESLKTDSKHTLHQLEVR